MFPRVQRLRHIGDVLLGELRSRAEICDGLRVERQCRRDIGRRENPGRLGADQRADVGTVLGRVVHDDPGEFELRMVEQLADD